MKNSANIEESMLENYEELLSMGLNSSADIFSKLLNVDVNFEATDIIYEEINGLESFGIEPGVVVALNLSGALRGRAAVVVQNVYAKSILNFLMNVSEEDSGEPDEIDEMSMGTFKELTGQMAAAFAESLTNFFGSNVNIETAEIYDLSEECEEISDIFGCSPDTEVYSIVSDFTIGSKLSGTFNIEVDQDTFDFTLDRLNMIPGNYAESEIFNAIAGGNDPMNLNITAGAGGRPVSVMKDSINVQAAQFPSFANQVNTGGASLLQGNMDLLMDVPLNVTIEIGKTRKKMRDIMDFAQGTVIDLEKQAGAPVDVVVNGQLIARGDVVVIDDNFGVRITEIIGNNSFSSAPKE